MAPRRDGSRSTQVGVIVRPNPRPYYRPPYAYGGYRFYCYHPYHYHPYRPYYWGPAWHPWGFFVATVAVTAIVVSVNNQNYYYDEGVYYEPKDDGEGYVVVEAPVGAAVSSLPKETEKITVEGETYYYYGGTFYQKEGDKYVVVPPMAGTVVENLPEGGKEVKVGDMTYVKVGDVYYQPTEVSGREVWEVAKVEEDSEGDEDWVEEQTGK